MIICISREFGSGGHEIGVRLSEVLHIPCYDRDLIEKAVMRSNIEIEDLEKADEKKENAWLHSIRYESNEPNLRGRSANEILYRVQKEMILELARKGDCIFVGRCADQVLKDAGIPCFCMFITAPFANRVKRKMELLDKDEKTVTALIRKTDKQRKSYYDYYTGGSWGKPYNYDLCINSTTYGIDKTVHGLSAFIAEASKEAL